MNNSTSPAPSSASSCDTPSVLGFGMFAYFIRLISIIFVVWQMTQNLGGFRESFRLSFQTLKTSSTRTLSIQKSLRNSSLICLFLTLVVQAIDQILRDVNRMLGYPCRVCSEVVQNFTSMFCQIFLVLTFIFMSYVTLFNYSKLSTVARGTSLYVSKQKIPFSHNLSLTCSLL